MQTKTSRHPLTPHVGDSVSSSESRRADDYRGGWRTDKGEAHTYEFSIRGDKVRGIYCTYCADATTLAFLDGVMRADGITFVVTHVKANGSTAYQDKATARFDRGSLVVTGTSGAPGGGKFVRTLIKDPRGPAPLPVNGFIFPKGPPRPRRENQSAGRGSAVTALHSARTMEVSV